MIIEATGIHHGSFDAAGLDEAVIRQGRMSFSFERRNANVVRKGIRAAVG